MLVAASSREGRARVWVPSAVLLLWHRHTMIASHYAETIGRKVEEGSIKGDSVKPNAMYTCRYEPTPAQQEPCYCKDPILPGGGSDGGNSRWNEFIIPGKTMASGLVEKGMQESMYEVGTAFTLHGQRFAGMVYSGEAAIYAAMQKDPPVNFPEHPHYPPCSQMGGYLRTFDCDCFVGKAFDTFICIGGDNSKATHAILTINAGLPTHLDEGTRVNQHALTAGTTMMPQPAVAAVGHGVAAAAAAPVPAIAPAIATGTLACDHPQGTTQIFIKLTPVPGTNPKHFRVGRSMKIQFASQQAVVGLALTAPRSRAVTYWHAAATDCDYRMIRQPVVSGKNPAHALHAKKRRAAWFGQTIHALGDVLAGNVGSNIDVSDIELEFDLPPHFSRIDWNDSDGVARHASIDLGEGKVKNWPYLHCVVLPFHAGWRERTDALEQEIIDMHTSYGISGVSCSVEEAGEKAKELLCRCSSAVNDLVLLTHSPRADLKVRRTDFSACFPVSS